MTANMNGGIRRRMVARVCLDASGVQTFRV